MSDVKPVARGKDFFVRLNDKLKCIRNQAVRLPRSADGTIGSTMQFVRKEHAALQAEIEALRKDAERLDYLANDMQDMTFNGVDVLDFIEEDCDWPKAWRKALDAAIAKEQS